LQNLSDVSLLQDFSEQAILELWLREFAFEDSFFELFSLGENWSAMIFEAITLGSSMANGKCLVNLKESGLELPALIAKELQMSTALESCSVR